MKCTWKETVCLTVLAWGMVLAMHVPLQALRDGVHWLLGLVGVA
jgi:hypothetical protein